MQDILVIQRMVVLWQEQFMEQVKLDLVRKIINLKLKQIFVEEDIYYVHVITDYDTIQLQYGCEVEDQTGKYINH